MFLIITSFWRILEHRTVVQLRNLLSEMCVTYKDFLRYAYEFKSAHESLQRNQTDLKWGNIETSYKMSRYLFGFITA